MKRPNRKPKHSIRELPNHAFVTGNLYLYLFHPRNESCPSRSSLWGIYDKTESGIIYLENSTLDQPHFPYGTAACGVSLLSLSTRQELRDYYI